jgi:hypothetical protein
MNYIHRIPLAGYYYKILRLQACDKSTNLLRSLSPAKKNNKCLSQDYLENKRTTVRRREKGLVSPPYILPKLKGKSPINRCRQCTK